MAGQPLRPPGTIFHGRRHYWQADNKQRSPGGWFKNNRNRTYLTSRLFPNTVRAHPGSAEELVEDPSVEEFRSLYRRLLSAERDAEDSLRREQSFSYRNQE